MTRACCFVACFDSLVASGFSPIFDSVLIDHLFQRDPFSADDGAKDRGSCHRSADSISDREMNHDMIYSKRKGLGEIPMYPG